MMWFDGINEVNGVNTNSRRTKVPKKYGRGISMSHKRTLYIKRNRMNKFYDDLIKWSVIFNGEIEISHRESVIFLANNREKWDLSEMNIVYSLYLQEYLIEKFSEVSIIKKNYLLLTSCLYLSCCIIEDEGSIGMDNIEEDETRIRKLNKLILFICKLLDYKFVFNNVFTLLYDEITNDIISDKSCKHLIPMLCLNEDVFHFICNPMDGDYDKIKLFFDDEVNAVKNMNLFHKNSIFSDSNQKYEESDLILFKKIKVIFISLFEK